jgi:hypothetical protein
MQTEPTGPRVVNFKPLASPHELLHSTACHVLLIWNTERPAESTAGTAATEALHAYGVYFGRTSDPLSSVLASVT